MGHFCAQEDSVGFRVRRPPSLAMLAESAGGSQNRPRLRILQKDSHSSLKAGILSYGDRERAQVKISMGGGPGGMASSAPDELPGVLSLWQHGWC